MPAAWKEGDHDQCQPHADEHEDPENTPQVGGLLDAVTVVTVRPPRPLLVDGSVAALTGERGGRALSRQEHLGEGFRHHWPPTVRAGGGNIRDLAIAVRTAH